MCILQQDLDDQFAEPPTVRDPLSCREENRLGLPRDLDRQDPPYGEERTMESATQRRDPVVATH
ncbi:hypothetical protein AB0C14_05275 [Microbispora hainanensis]|uniref:hypothetical protein n=1 Tax=Microbispora hainanensis TaxID=568844 RepID=UPI0033CDF78E